MIKNLPVKLNDNELRAKGDELAKCAAEINALEQEKAEKSAEIGGKIKAERKQMSRLADEISSRREYRDVNCQENIDYTTGVAITVRLDNNEEIARRLITPEERQMKIKVAPLKKEKVDG